MIQTVNFKYVPGDHRVLFVSAMSIGWNAFLSKMQHGHHEATIEAVESQPVQTTKIEPSKIDKIEKTEKNEVVAISQSASVPLVAKKLETKAIALK